MDRNAYLNEEYDDSNDHYREKAYHNFGRNNEEPDYEGQDAEYQQYYKESHISGDDPNENGDHMGKRVPSGQELQDKSGRNTLNTPANTNYLGAPKFAPIDNQDAGNYEEHSGKNVSKSYNDHEDLEIQETYNMNNRTYSRDDDEDRQTSGTNFQNRLLDCRTNRKKVEMDVQALANRVALLENEEKKLLGKIEDTKRKALEIMHIKKSAKQHQSALSEKNQRANWEKERNHEKVQQQKNELQDGLEHGRRMAAEKNLSKAESVKQNLQNLREQYKQKKMQDQAEQIHNVNNIKLFERDLEAKKREHQHMVQMQAKERYENQIREEENTTDQYLNQIERLEEQEKKLIERLKVTQSQHQMVIDDLERIHENGQASGPLVSLSKEFEAGDFKKKGNFKKHWK